MGCGPADLLDGDVDALDALHAVGMAARSLGGLLRDQRDVGDAVARAHRGRIRFEIVARERDRLEAVARRGRELQGVAVVAGYAAVVDVEADATVGVDAGRDVRDADRDVVDAGKNRLSPSRAPPQTPRAHRYR